MDFATAYHVTEEFLPADMEVNFAINSEDTREDRRQYTVTDLHAHIGLLHVNQVKMNTTKKKIVQLKKLLEEEEMTCNAVRRQTKIIFDHVRREVEIELNDCPICLEQINIESLKLAYIVECNHTFHSSCLSAWLKEDKKTCPMCRQSPITPRIASAEAVLYGSILLKDMTHCGIK